MRNYKGKYIELLAPIGNYQMSKEILDSPCDAVYLGGKNFNMRMHSELMNFTEDEIVKTINYAHSLNKKVYITVNSLIEEDLLQDVKSYLEHLKSIKVDAIIVQDLAIIEIVKKYNIDIELHASVMMNTHSIEQIKFLENSGFTRYVSSRELPLSQVSELAKQSNLEIEYFVSGDMCSVNDSLCYYSGMIFNRSSNKGQCFKICRWKYDICYDGFKYEQKYHLAAKDVDLIKFYKELCESSVNSFKIEGRRKQAKDLLPIINAHAKALDSFLESGNNEVGVKLFNTIEDVYNRSVSTSYAFGEPSIDYINSKNEGDNTKNRVFSTASKEVIADEQLINKINDKIIEETKNIYNNNYEISIKVQNKKQALKAIKENADIIYIALDALNDNCIEVDDVNYLINNCNNSKIFISLPAMVHKDETKFVDSYIKKVNKSIRCIST